MTAIKICSASDLHMTSIFKIILTISILTLVLNACSSTKSTTKSTTSTTDIQSPLHQEKSTSNTASLIQNAIIDSDADGVEDNQDKCKNTAPGAAVNLAGCALDTDGDKVADFKDQCRGTPFGIKVDERGCGFDEDRDGVPNFRDDCAATPLDVNVDGDGCEWDSDNDGVADSRDKCAGTPPGVQVEPMGCLVMEIVTLEGVHFRTGSAELNPSARSVLRSLARTLRKHPKMRVEIAGHTDDTGARAINRDLSIKRAYSAKKQLIDMGVSTKVLTAKGYADSQPVASNETEAGRAKNRRVELRIVEID